MIHVDDSPTTVTLLAERSAPSSKDMVAERDAKIVFHPDRIAYRVMRARNNQELGRRAMIEIALAIIRQHGVAPVKVAARCKYDYLSATSSARLKAAPQRLICCSISLTRA
jgi:hypothetical protein